MKRGRQRVHSNWARSSCGTCICGKRKLVLPNFLCSCRKVGPPPSSRQYQSAKTSTFVSQSNAPESKSWSGDSLCDGNARTNRITDPTNASVVIPLIKSPSARLSERFPVRCATTVGTSKTTIKVGSNQVGPTISELGSDKKIPQKTTKASSTCQRASGY